MFYQPRKERSVLCCETVKLCPEASVLKYYCRGLSYSDKKKEILPVVERRLKCFRRKTRSIFEKFPSLWQFSIRDYIIYKTTPIVLAAGVVIFEVAGWTALLSPAGHLNYFF